MSQSINVGIGHVTSISTIDTDTYIFPQFLNDPNDMEQTFKFIRTSDNEELVATCNHRFELSSTVRTTTNTYARSDITRPYE